MQDLLDLVQAITPEDKISLRTTEGISITTLDQVSFIQKERDAIKVYLTDGSEGFATSDPQVFFDGLNSRSNWFKTHRDILINLRNLIEINPDKPPEQQLEEDRLSSRFLSSCNPKRWVSLQLHLVNKV
jgi:DNA-binding LytR/AlgR family response regulator